MDNSDQRININPTSNKKLSLITCIKNNIFKFLLLLSLGFLIYSIYNLTNSLNNIGIQDLNQNMIDIANRLSKLDEVNQQLIELNQNFNKINITLLTDTFLTISKNFNKLEELLKNPIIMTGNMFKGPTMNQKSTTSSQDNFDNLMGYYNGKLEFSF